MEDNNIGLLDLAALPAVGATLLDPRPAFVFRADGRVLRFANAAAAAFLGETSIGGLLERAFADDDPLARQMARLAKSLPADNFREELLRFTFGSAQVAVPARCQRLGALAERAVLAVLTVGTARATPGTLARQLVDALASEDDVVAVLDRDGHAIEASGGFALLAPASPEIGSLINAAATAAEGVARRPIAVEGVTQSAAVVEFDASSDTLYLLVVGSGARSRGVADGPLDRGKEPAPVAEVPPTPTRAEPAVPESPSLAKPTAQAVIKEAPAPVVATPATPPEQARRPPAPLAFSEEDIDDVARKSVEEGRKPAAQRSENPEPMPEAPVKPSPPEPLRVVPAAAARSNVVRMPGAPVRAFPPERLTGLEQDAFRRIAEALGVKMAEVREQSAEANEEAARDSGQAYTGVEARLLDKLPVGVVVYSDRQTLFANRALLDLLGYATFADFAAAGGAEAVFPEGAAARSAKGGKGEVSARRRDGSGVPVEARLHGIAWGPESAAMLSLVKRNEARREPLPDRAFMSDLAAAGDRVEELEAILDTATDGIVVIGRDGRIENFNRSAEALFGVPGREVIGRPFIELFAEESRKAALDYLDGLSSNGVASVLNDGREVIGKVPKGGLIPLFMTLGRISGGQKFCAVLRDITHWKNVEEELVAARRAAESANAQKSEFLAKISHEIRTPLNAIIGFSEVMMQERFGPVGNDRYRAYLRDIHVSGDHLLSLINDLLDLSKIEAGKVELAFESVAINDIIQESVALMQPQANRQRIIIRTSLSAGVPNVVADPRSLRQILLNLLSNAVKFTGAGGQVIVATALEESGEVELRIRDTGVGMSEKDLETAMKPFAQVGSTHDGTGLGLPLTKALVEANRATFAIDSAPGQGTLVKVIFPTTRVLAG